MTDTTNVETLRAAWRALKQEQPRLRIRDAASALGVSEAQLLATDIGNGVVRLAGDWGRLLQELPALGDVMALTRNQHAVHERKGSYRNVSVRGTMGLVLDEEIDLRVFLAHWQLGFAVTESVGDGVRRSLQFFDGNGTAVHKVYVPTDAMGAFDRLVERFRCADQSPALSLRPAAADATERSDDEIDYAALYDDWRALRDTHDFFPMLRRHNVSRRQALRNASAELATEVDRGALEFVLRTAAQESLPVMVFVGSRGVIQIHTGAIERVVATEGWINVLDTRFNLHVRVDGIDSAWVVRKPTDDGTVTSLELLDAAGEVVALIFGRRKPGIPEQERWRALAERTELLMACSA